jgi:prepilin-type N-terminal cleavage/methylation domain-containing protein
MKKTQTNTRGFTLIELLVVIAIIGILSSVVLASLNTARGKGVDATVKSNLDQIRTQAEIIYDNASPNSYTGTCSNTTVASQLSSAANALGGTVDTTIGNAGSATKVSCHESSTAWAVSSGLKNTPANSYCVDNTGKSETVAGAFIAANAVACP